jgi:hypothetical protein
MINRNVMEMKQHETAQATPNGGQEAAVICILQGKDTARAIYRAVGHIRL